VTDFCPHPCGMIHGAWVDVVPGSDGAAVTRLDSETVSLQVRFHNDVAETRTVGRDDFKLELPPAMFPAVTGRAACPAWTPRTLHIDEATENLALCFAVPQSDSVALEKLFLDWRQPGDSIQISLAKFGPGTINIGASPSAS